MHLNMIPVPSPAVPQRQANWEREDSAGTRVQMPPSQPTFWNWLPPGEADLRWRQVKLPSLGFLSLPQVSCDCREPEEANPRRWAG